MLKDCVYLWMSDPRSLLPWALDRNVEQCVCDSACVCVCVCDSAHICATWGGVAASMNSETDWGWGS